MPFYRQSLSVNFQSRFLRFHQNILLSDNPDLAQLRDKRNIVLGWLRSKNLTFDSFNQGSYAMSTGVKPVKTDYDIDVGVVFTGQLGHPNDPREVKGWVHDALEAQQVRTEWMKHCVRVQYIQGGSPIYHVDLAVYWKNAWTGKLSLAVGKQHSGVNDREWQASDPQGLIHLVKNYRTGGDRNQFRRVIRCLKRWRDVHFPIEGNAAPVGIGLTVVALAMFTPRKKDQWSTGDAAYDDLEALLNFVRVILANFTQCHHPSGFGERLLAPLPVDPRKDVFDRMTTQQMTELKIRLSKLAEDLQEAKLTGLVAPLQQAFGSDFPQ